MKFCPKSVSLNQALLECHLACFGAVLQYLAQQDTMCECHVNTATASAL